MLGTVIVIGKLCMRKEATNDITEGSKCVQKEKTQLRQHNLLHLKGLYQLGGMRNRVPALTEQFEIVVPTFFF